MPQRTVDIEFPLAGVRNDFAYQRQPPFTCADAINVRRLDPSTSRLRGGSRAGLLKPFEGKPDGTATPVALLHQFQSVETANVSRSVTHAFTVPPLSDLSLLSDHSDWVADPGAVDGSPDTQVDQGAGVGIGQFTGAIHTIISNINNDDVSFRMQLMFQRLGVGIKPVWYMYVSATNAIPTTDGIVCKYDHVENKIQITQYIAGVAQTPIASASPSAPAVAATSAALELRINSTNKTIEARFNGSTVVTLTATTTVLAILGQYGFAIDATLASDSRLFVRAINLSYRAAGVTQSKVQLRVAAATNQNNFATTDLNGKFVDITTQAADKIDTTKDIWPVQSVAYHGNTYYTLSSRAADLALRKILASSIQAVTGVAAVPGFCSAIAVYQDRIVLTSDQQDPTAWYMCKQGDATNWDMTDETIRGAVDSTTSLVDTGRSADPLVCCIPSKDDLLVFGGSSSIHVLRGDPRRNGRLDLLSATVGIASSMSWAILPDARILILTPNSGLRMLDFDTAEGVSPISDARFPRELQDANADQYAISMAYDLRHNGVYICLADKIGTGGIFYWFDIALGALWPMKFNNTNHEPFVLHAFSDVSFGGTGISGVLAGCRDGNVRLFKDGVSDDDDSPINSHVTYGPFKLALREQAGAILELNVALGENSGDVAWSVFAGDSAEDAFKRSSPQASGIFSAGRNNTARPKVRGHSVYVKLGSSFFGEAWAIESLGMVVETPLGPARVR